MTRDGKYIPATPIPGTVVVNIGDLMQRWAADVIVSNVSAQYFYTVCNILFMVEIK